MRFTLPLLSAVLSLIISDSALAADQGNSAAVRRAELHIGFERLSLPGNESLGLVGNSYLLELDSGWLVGPAVYGALTGQRGGFFTIGAEVARRHRLAGPLGLEFGFYAGGGGGGSARVGGGLMLRPHVGLVYDWGRFRSGVSLSQVRFPNGDINSRQWGFVISTDTAFVTSPKSDFDSMGGGQDHSGVGFDRMYAISGVYRPVAGARRISDGAAQPRLGVAGVRFERKFSNGQFWGLETAGAASGGAAGYAEYLAGTGVEKSVGDGRFMFGVRAAAGMGGGGDVDVGGGLLLRGAGYAGVRFSRDFGMIAEVGRTKAPQGSFGGTQLSMALLWDLDHPADLQTTARSVHSNWIGGIEHYSAARSDGSTKALSNVVLAVNRFLTDTAYLSGQAHSAYSGDAGGYSVGLFGGGLQWPVMGRGHLGIELLIGAAGGGGVETSGGGIAQSSAYAAYEVLPSIELRIGVGRIRGLKGPLDSRVVHVALTYAFNMEVR